MILDERLLNQIEINLTNVCNYRCTFCAAAATINAPPREIPEDIFKNIISQIKYKTILGIIGGEPLVYFQNREHLYDYVFDNPNIYPLFTTNGSLINKQSYLLKKLQESEFAMLVSMEGMYSTYESLRKNGSWSNMVKSLKAVSDIISNKNDNFSLLNIQYIAMKPTIEELMDFVKFAEDINVDKIGVIHLIHSPPAIKLYNTCFEELYINDAQYYLDKVMEVKEYLANNKSNLSFSCKRVLGEHVSYYSNSFLAKQRKLSEFMEYDKLVIPKEYRNITCFRFLQYVIGSDLCVSPCCGGRNIVIGNCSQSNIYEIFNSEASQKVRRDLIKYDKPIYCNCAEVHQQGNYAGKSSSIKANVLEEKYKKYVKKFNEMKDNNIDAAISYLENVEVYDFDRTSIIIWNELAGAYLYRKKDYEKAKYYIDKILDIHPYSSSAQLKKAVLFIETGEFEGAIKTLEQIRVPSEPLSYYWLGFAYEKINDVENMIDNYNNFINICERNNILMDTWGYKHAKEVIGNGK